MSATHVHPYPGLDRTPCCNRTLTELNDDDRLTRDPDRQTCLGRKRTIGRPRTPCAHWIAGIWINCCEQGETDCLCVCHGPAGRT